MFVGGSIQHVVFSGPSSTFSSLLGNSSIFHSFGSSMLHFNPSTSVYTRKSPPKFGATFSLTAAQDALQVAQINRAAKEYHLNEQSNAAAGVTNEGHATEMPDVALELLQNAVDSSCASVSMRLDQSTFSLSHYGSRPFSLVDLTSITSYGASSKLNAANFEGEARKFIGRKGIGFKAALLVSSRVEILNYPYFIVFQCQHHENRRGVANATIERLDTENLASTSSRTDKRSALERSKETTFTLTLKGKHEVDTLANNLESLANTLPTLVVLKTLKRNISKLTINNTTIKITKEPKWKRAGQVRTNTIEIEKKIGTAPTSIFSFHALRQKFGKEYDFANVCICLPEDAKPAPSVLHSFLPISKHRLPKCSFTIHAPFAVSNSRQQLAKGPLYKDKQNRLWDAVAITLISMMQHMFLHALIGDYWRLFPIGVKELQQPFLVEFRRTRALLVRHMGEFDLERPSNQCIWNSDQPAPKELRCMDLTPEYCYATDTNAIAAMLAEVVKLSEHGLFRDFWHNENDPNAPANASSPFEDFVCKPTEMPMCLLPDYAPGFSPKLHDRKWTLKAIDRIKEIVSDSSKYQKPLKALLQIATTESRPFVLFEHKPPFKKTVAQVPIHHIPCSWLKHLSSLILHYHQPSPELSSTLAEPRENFPKFEIDPVAGHFGPFPGLSVDSSSKSSLQWILPIDSGNDENTTLLRPNEVILGTLSASEREFVPSFEPETGDNALAVSICLALGFVPPHTERGIALRLKSLKFEHSRRLALLGATPSSAASSEVHKWASACALRLYEEMTALLHEYAWSEKSAEKSLVDWQGLLLVKTAGTASRNIVWTWTNPEQIVRKGPGPQLDGHVKEKHFLALSRMGVRKVSYRFCFDYLHGSIITRNKDSPPKSIQDGYLKIVFKSIASILSGRALDVKKEEILLVEQYLEHPVLFDLNGTRNERTKLLPSSRLSQSSNKTPPLPLIVLPQYLQPFLSLMEKSPGKWLTARFMHPKLFKCFSKGDRSFSERNTTGHGFEQNDRLPLVISRLIQANHLQICASLPVVVEPSSSSSPYLQSSSSQVLRALNETSQLLRSRGWNFDLKFKEASTPSSVAVSFDNSVLSSMLRLNHSADPSIEMKACVIKNGGSNIQASSSAPSASGWTIILPPSLLPSSSVSFSSSSSHSKAASPDKFLRLLEGCLVWFCNILPLEIGENEPEEEIRAALAADLFVLFRECVDSTSGSDQGALDSIVFRIVGESSSSFYRVEEPVSPLLNLETSDIQHSGFLESQPLLAAVPPTSLNLASSYAAVAPTRAPTEVSVAQEIQDKTLPRVPGRFVPPTSSSAAVPPPRFSIAELIPGTWQEDSIELPKVPRNSTLGRSIGSLLSSSSSVEAPITAPLQTKTHRDGPLEDHQEEQRTTPLSPFNFPRRFLGRQLPPSPLPSKRSADPNSLGFPSLLKDFEQMTVATSSITSIDPPLDSLHSMTPQTKSKRRLATIPDEEKKAQGDVSEAVALVYERHRITELLLNNAGLRDSFFEQVLPLLSIPNEGVTEEPLKSLVSHCVRKHPDNLAAFDIYSWHYQATLSKWVPLKVEVKSTRTDRAEWEMSKAEYDLVLLATPESPHHIYLYIDFQLSSIDTTNLPLREPSSILEIESAADLTSVRHQPTHYHFSATSQLKKIAYS